MSLRQYKTKVDNNTFGRDGFIVTTQDQGEHMDFIFLGTRFRIRKERFDNLYQLVERNAWN